MARVFRLFISSTFQDWHPEREYLRTYVFPRLQKKCEDKGARFLPVDLRWGVSEEAAKNHETVSICLEEIERCQRLTPRPNFLVLLGDRYGWRPVPTVIAQNQWEELNRLNIIKDQDLWAKWYKLNKNSSDPEYVLQAKGDGWCADERKLREQLDHLVEVEHAFTENELAFLIGSVTEQEIVRGAMAVADAQNHVHVFERKFSNDIRHAESSDLLDSHDDRFSKDLLSTLKSRLSEHIKGNYHKFAPQTFNGLWAEGKRPEGYLEALGSQVFASLNNIIENELKFDELEIVEAPDTGCFIGRNSELEMLKQSRAHPIMVFGKPGSGKSTLLSRYAEELIAIGTPVLSFWIGRDPTCATGSDLLRAILKRLREGKLVRDDFHWLDYSTADFIESTGMLAHALHNLRKEKSDLVVIVDGVDQLGKDDPARDLNWISCDCRFVFSTLNDDHRDQFSSRFGDDAILRMCKLDQPYANALLEKWLSHDGRNLQPKQMKVLIDVFDGMPLHLRVLYEQARNWYSYDPLPDQLPTSADLAIQQFYDRLSSGSEHGSVMVRRTLAYLAVSPNGLNESELLALLRMDEYVVAAFRHRSPQSPPVDALPEIVWSRLFHDLEPFLAERRIHGELLFDFYHMQFKRMAREWVGENTLFSCQSRLASLMLRLWGLRGEKASLRQLYVLPKILADAHDDDELYHLTKDNHFLEAQKKTEVSLPISTFNIAINSAIKHLPMNVSNTAEILIRKGKFADKLRGESPWDAMAAGDFHRAIGLVDASPKKLQLAWLAVLECICWMKNDQLSRDVIQSRVEKITPEAGDSDSDWMVVLLNKRMTSREPSNSLMDIVREKQEEYRIFQLDSVERSYNELVNNITSNGNSLKGRLGDAYVCEQVKIIFPLLSSISSSTEVALELKKKLPELVNACEDQASRLRAESIMAVIKKGESIHPSVGKKLEDIEYIAIVLKKIHSLFEGDNDTLELMQIKALVEMKRYDEAEDIASRNKQYETYCILCEALQKQGNQYRAVSLLEKIDNTYLVARVAAFMARGRGVNPFTEMFFSKMKDKDIDPITYKEAFTLWICDRPFDAAKAMGLALLNDSKNNSEIQLRLSFVKFLSTLMQRGMYKQTLALFDQVGAPFFDNDPKQVASNRLGLRIEAVEIILNNVDADSKQDALNLLKEIEDMWPEVLKLSDGLYERLAWQILRIACCYAALTKVEDARKWLSFLNQVPMRKFGSHDHQKVAKGKMKNVLRKLEPLDRFGTEEIYRAWIRNGNSDALEKELETFLACDDDRNMNAGTLAEALPPLQRKDVDDWLGYIKGRSLGDVIATNINEVLSRYFERMDFSDEAKVKYLLTNLTGSFAESLWACTFLFCYMHVMSGEDGSLEVLRGLSSGITE